MSSFIPAIPFIQDHFAVSTTTAQLTLTLSMLAMAVTSLAYGGLADRYGRKPVLIAGILVAVVGSLVCAVATSVGGVIAGRILQSLDGHLFHFVGEPNRYGLPAFYELHVWAWQENPNGTFTDFNPEVACDAQPADPT